MSDIFDLDALVPPSKHIKVRGKMLECKPLTIRQTITLIKLEQKMLGIQNVDEIMPLIKEALGPCVPAILEDETVDFTIYELRQIIRFAQKISIPEVAPETQPYTDPKKKVISQEASPTSSGSTPATQPKNS